MGKMLKKIIKHRDKRLESDNKFFNNLNYTNEFSGKEKEEEAVKKHIVKPAK